MRPENMPSTEFSAAESSDVDQHIIAIDLYGIDGDFRSAHLRFAGFSIPLPSMPRADHFPLFDDALPERASAMNARVFHGVDLPVNAAHGRHRSAQRKSSDRSRRDAD